MGFHRLVAEVEVDETKGDLGLPYIPGVDLRLLEKLTPTLGVVEFIVCDHPLVEHKLADGSSILGLPLADGHHTLVQIPLAYGTKFKTFTTHPHAGRYVRYPLRDGGFDEDGIASRGEIG